MGPLLHERDLYIAWSLKRSKAVNGTKCVVGVFGRGHLRGVCYHLLTDPGTIRFRDLVGRGASERQGTGLQQGLIVRLGLEMIAGAACYAAWQAYSGP